MKSVLIIYGQALTDEILDIINQNHIRGYTKWEETFGRGGDKGEPHLGSHAWPSKNSTVLCVVEDHKVEPLLNSLRELNSQVEEQGINAFVWHIENRM